jgi:hypothetical protein
MGSGIEGSNMFIDKPSMYIVGKPDIQPIDLLITYYKVYGTFPEEISTNHIGNTIIRPGQRRMQNPTLIGFMDEKLDNIYRIVTINPLTDAFLRLRNIQDSSNSKKPIYAFCPVPDKIRQCSSSFVKIKLNDHFIPESFIDDESIERFKRLIDENGYVSLNGWKVRQQQHLCRLLKRYDLDVVYDQNRKVIRKRHI